MFYEGYWFDTSLTSTVAYFIISFVTILGNILVFVSFHRDPYRQLRSLQNYFIVNLAVSDLFMGTLAEWLLIATYWVNLPDVFFAHYLGAIISGISSLLNMTALSIYRYFVVKNPLTYHDIITRKRVIAAIVAVWIYTFHLILLPLSGWQSEGYQIYLYSLGCVLPSCVIFVTYFGVFITIRAHTKNLKTTANSQNSALKSAVNREKATTKTMLILLAVFVVFWFPFLAIDIVMVQCIPCRESHSLHVARDVALTFTYFSSGINPLLYAWRVQQFRRAFIRVLGLKKLNCWSKNRVGNNMRNAQTVIERDPRTAWVT
ncbi:alpha-1B adrenergic receptor [Nematostella vectensis]|uniref:alpha-1B adrenergic receptor n=1 Tax=Nematostella vectensis TaxID=45351 RepID=UPI0020777A62|nr:alpha-1B adrenergic receptor [Nematostella vectensis]XP_032234124.2 alpha-1B adrenergic receptor [Nematostella vectensis]